MKTISSLQILLSSLLVGLSTISCAAPTSPPNDGLPPAEVASPSLSASSSPSPQNYVEATPVPETAPSASTTNQNPPPNKDVQPDPSLTPGQPDPAIQATRIKEPYEKDGSPTKTTSEKVQQTEKPIPPVKPGEPQAPKIGIPQPPKPGIPSAPAPGKPQEPRTVIPANPKPAVPHVKVVQPASPSRVQATPSPVQHKSTSNKSKVKINLKNLPDKQ